MTALLAPPPPDVDPSLPGGTAGGHRARSVQVYTSFTNTTT